MISQMNSTVTVLVPILGAEDEYGNPKIEWVTTSHKALVAWGATGTDYGVGRNLLTTQATLYFTQSIAAPIGSKFIINDATYVFDGEQVNWKAPAGWSLKTGSIIQVKKQEG